MSQELRLDGRVAFVTGAAQGLGRAHALALAAKWSPTTAALRLPTRRPGS